MDPQVQSSFIPKKSLDISASRSEGSFGLLFLIALLIFIASIVAAAGSFLYTGYLNAQISAKSKSLTLAEGAFDPGTIKDLVRLDSRLSQSQKLLGNHIAVSGIFSLLATQTLQNVSFKDFDYTIGDGGTPTISMHGSANSFSTVALQSDQFNAEKLLKNVIFSNIEVATDGTVSFQVAADVDPSVVSYNASLTASGATPATATPTTTTTSTTTPGGAPPITQ